MKLTAQRTVCHADRTEWAVRATLRNAPPRVYEVTAYPDGVLHVYTGRTEVSRAKAPKLHAAIALELARLA